MSVLSWMTQFVVCPRLVPSGVFHPRQCYDLKVNAPLTCVRLILTRRRRESGGREKRGVGGGTVAGDEGECWPHCRAAHSLGSHTFPATPGRQTLSGSEK